MALHRTSDPLPEGLTLNADGTITGTPVATGTVDKLRVTATSDAGTSSYRTLTLEVMLAAPEITTQYLPDAVVGQAYSNQLEATGSGEIKWSIQDVDALPDGADVQRRRLDCRHTRCLCARNVYCRR